MIDLKYFEQKYSICSYDVDQNCSARLTSILNYMQDAAWLHYQSFEEHNGKIMPDNYGWLLSRIRLQAETFPEWGDSVKLETWSPGLSRMFALRDFIFHDKNEKPLIKASTAWLIIDINKGLPVRPDFFKEKWTFSDRNPLIDITSKLKACEGSDKSSSVRAVYSDIDVNRHVNNAKYVEWMLNIYKDSFINKHIPYTVRIDFTGQAVLGDSVEIRLKQVSDKEIYTNAVLDGKDLCRMFVSWKEK
jgi:medium-chain acyl-[acyl-carrier-protein] hydrolase